MLIIVVLLDYKGATPVSKTSSLLVTHLVKCDSTSIGDTLP